MSFDPGGYEAAPIGPRMGLALWCAAVELAERVTDDPDLVRNALPPAAWAYAEKPEWLDRLSGCFRAVRDRLELGVFPLARSTGEEFALHVALSLAGAQDATGAGPSPEQFGLQFMPAPDDQDFVSAHRRLLDGDLLLLFDPLFDGIEDPASEVNQRLVLGPLLHPARWFDQFPGFAAVAPLERMGTEPDAEQETIDAAAALATRTRAVLFQVRRIVERWPNSSEERSVWTVHARWRRADIRAEGATAEAATLEFVRQLVAGAHCHGCGAEVTIEPTASGCVWRRDRDVWRRGCDGQSATAGTAL